MITALILAAGQSTRMGRPKMSLAWGRTTVLGHIIDVFKAAGVENVLAVVGGERYTVQDIAQACGATTVFNPKFASEEMLSSLQIGLRSISEDTDAALVGLGDQPQIQEQTIRLILGEYQESAAPLIVPSYRMRRGHPWLIARELWPAILSLHSPLTPRDFLARHADSIHYVDVETPTVLQDLDTPEDYSRSASSG